MESREEKIRRLKEARSKYTELTRLKLNKTTSSKEFSLGQVRKVEDHFKPIQENYSKHLEGNIENATPKTHRSLMKPKHSIIGGRVINDCLRGKVENIENVAVTDAGKRRAMELLQTIANGSGLISNCRISSKKPSDITLSTGRLKLNKEDKERNTLKLVDPPLNNEEASISKVTKSSKKVCFADDFVPSTYNRDNILSNNFECETPVTGRVSRQPKQSIVGIRQPRSTNISGALVSIDDVPVTEEGRKKAMDHLYRLIGSSTSRNGANYR